MLFPLAHQPHELAKVVAATWQSPEAHTAWASLYTSCHTPAVRFVVRTFALGEATAEDVVGSFFVGLPLKLTRAKDKVAGFEEGTDFMYWFWRVLRNHTYDHLRKARTRLVRAQATREEPTPWRATDHQVDAERIWEMIKRMKYPEREVLLLYYGWAFNQREIADMLDLGHDNVRRIKLRALARLRVRLVRDEETQR